MLIGQDKMIGADAKGQARLMTGNEAIARGAVEAGIRLGAGYPGTPSSEILETLGAVAKQLGIYVEWSTNEKVAFETAYGASMTGLRSLVTMKHAGGNVILDSLSKMVYTGTKGGFLVITCDDPGALSSSNEQDNRFLGQFVEMPIFEPSSPQEAKDMVVQAFDLSEHFSLPIMLRSVTRLSHGKSKVELGKPRQIRRQPYFDRNDGMPDRWFCCAFNHLVKHRDHHERIGRFTQRYIEKSPFNRIEGSDSCQWGIITTGIAYNFAKEALKALDLEDKVAILKIGLPYPLAHEITSSFLSSKKKVLVLEESDPFLENQLRILAQVKSLMTHIDGQYTGSLERPGEITFERTATAIERSLRLKRQHKQVEKARKEAASILKPRPLTMCPGCPHRATHMALVRALNKLKIEHPIILGDIGCYELGHEPPFDDIDSIYNMGAGIGLANGLAHSGLRKEIIALIGDSTLLHSGLPGFINAVHNRANITMIVFDNSTIAMTGHQAPVNSARTLMGDRVPGASIVGLLKASQTGLVVEANAFNLKETQKAIEKAIKVESASAVIVHGPCALEHDRIKRKQGISTETYRVEQDRCIGCRICLDQFGCPALVWNQDDEKVKVDHFICNGCGVCVQVCPREAFQKAGQTEL